MGLKYALGTVSFLSLFVLLCFKNLFLDKAAELFWEPVGICKTIKGNWEIGSLKIHMKSVNPGL